MSDPLLDAIHRTLKGRTQELIALRRELHAHPELSHDERRTTALLADRLRALGFDVRARPEGVGLLADLTPIGLDLGRTVAVRSDIDALPIEELTGLPFASTRAGVMHACGHDVHMSCVMGVAEAMSACRDALPGRVRLIYQHSEEVSPGGADEMVAFGAMEGVDAVLGVHCDPVVPVGQIGVRAGAFTASSDAFTLTVTGQGGHSARPHQAIDPVFVGVQIASALYQLAGRVFDARDPVVIAIGAIQAGRQHNIIPDALTLKGTARSLSKAHRHEIEPWMRRTIAGLCDTYGAAFTLEINPGAPSIINDEGLTRVVERVAVDLLGGAQVHRIDLPSMGAEDFSWYLEHAPGCMFRLGTAAPDAPRHMLHSPCFNPSEAAIPIGAQILSRAAVAVLRGEGLEPRAIASKSQGRRRGP